MGLRTDCGYQGEGRAAGYPTELRVLRGCSRAKGLREPSLLNELVKMLEVMCLRVLGEEL